ncbi:histidine kinase [Terrimonas sp. NA20]|uniref:Histidine kinase n=1 Tax=Terrimonas ginsenosidimutans TaxID=2908004 RepID=A0ABS9KP47_9BACT|nr:histidine kinase [Terrimonas ginsenosidimutans]MCG2614103.1 histidine kinase [Terrimonas ginsenosidimutans]
MTKKALIGVHLAYWFYFMIVTEFANNLAYKNRWFALSDNIGLLFISNLVIFGFIFYFNYLVLLPRFFKRRKFLQLILSWILLSISFVGLRYFFQEYLFLKYFNTCNFCYTDYGRTWPIYAVNNFFQGLSSFIMAGTIIWFADDWLRSEKQKMRLQKEKVEAERAFLQAQVSPHFLFNSLNNIYSMVYHGSEDSLPAIQKLSGMMRYIISESHSVWIDLTKELLYLDDYIQLQKYRIKDAAIQYTIMGDPASKVIAPLILISFVENAFKHGIVTDQANPVVIRMEIMNDSLKFYIANKINPDSKDSVSGIGLKNVESRLGLQYPGTHSLAVKTENGIFEASLSIDSLKEQQL